MFTAMVTRCKKRSSGDEGKLKGDNHPLLTAGMKRNTARAQSTPPHFQGSCSVQTGIWEDWNKTSNSKEGLLKRDSSICGGKMQEDSLAGTGQQLTA